LWNHLHVSARKLIIKTAMRRCLSVRMTVLKDRIFTRLLRPPAGHSHHIRHCLPILPGIPPSE
jgi:hypothetical protein